MLPIANPKFNRQALENVEECVRTGWISSQGRFVREFEDRFADYIGVSHAIATSSGTAALHLALAALDIGADDGVLVPSYTFIAPANAVVYTGAKPVFCDVDPNAWCLDVKDARGRITRRTKAIIPVHINGHPCDMKEVLRLALDYNLHVIEDACQALGSSLEHRRLGSIGSVGCFSFFANKQLTTGEGGMCTTNCGSTAKTIRMLRDHGRDTEYRDQYVHSAVGFNYRMTNLQAAVGITQLGDLGDAIDRRRGFYGRWFGAIGLPGNTQSWHAGQSPWLYMLKLRSLELVRIVIDALKDVDIEAKPFFRPCHLQAPYYDAVDLPVSESLFGVMLPLHEGITSEHLKSVKTVLESTKSAMATV